MDILASWGISLDYIIFGLLGSCLVLLIFIIILFVKTSSLKKKYKAFMGGKDAPTLENLIIDRFQEIESLKLDNKKIINKLESITENLLVTYQKIGIVKYDAFHEMGGKLSFSLCLLNDKNDGFIINSMHSSREGCYSYIKEIINGESFVVLAKEEQLALEEAMNKTFLV